MEFFWKYSSPFCASILNIGCLENVLIIFKSINLICSTLSNDPDVNWHKVFAVLYEAPVLGILKISKILYYIGKWNNYKILECVVLLLAIV